MAVLATNIPDESSVQVITAFITCVAIKRVKRNQSF